MRKKRKHLISIVILIICMMTACGENPQASDSREDAASSQVSGEGKDAVRSQTSGEQEDAASSQTVDEREDAANSQTSGDWEDAANSQTVDEREDAANSQTSGEREDAANSQTSGERKDAASLQTADGQNDMSSQQISGSQDISYNMEVIQEQVMAEMSDEQKNWMGGLDEARRLEDFASLCDGLRENYPYLVLAKRQAGADIDVLEEAYREKVRACANDDMLYKVLKDFVGEFAFTGHLELWGRRYESELESWNKMREDPALKDKSELYIAVLDNPVSHKTYASMTAFYQEVDRRAQVRIGEMMQSERQTESEGNNQTALQTEYEMTPNVETRILEPGKAAYISISFFDHEQMEADREILLPFYERIRDYDNLIIDITENPGGSMRYFNDLIAAPLAKETLIVPSYQFFKDGENNGRFLKVEEGVREGLYQPVSNLPDLPELNREDVADCAYFMREDYTVHPKGKGFDGKIWLLVSSNNYSSSEYAAMFSKAAGFATLVGENTRGDGIGTDPVYLILPNSGLVVQYSPMYGVTADGTGSEEYGTVPDIVSPPGESALDTCIRCME